MDRTEVVEAVYDACVELLKAERSDLSEATNFADDLDADSLDLVEVVMSLEDRFDMKIPEDDLELRREFQFAIDQLDAPEPEYQPEERDILKEYPKTDIPAIDMMDESERIEMLTSLQVCEQHQTRNGDQDTDQEK